MEAIFCLYRRMGFFSYAHSDVVAVCGGSADSAGGGHGGGGGACSIGILVLLAGSLAGGGACVLANCVVLWTLFAAVAGLQARGAANSSRKRGAAQVLISCLLLLNRLPSKPLFWPGSSEAKPGTGKIRGNLRAESASRGRSCVPLLFSLITHARHAMQHDATQSQLYLQKGSEGGLFRRLTAAHAGTQPVFSL